MIQLTFNNPSCKQQQSYGSFNLPEDKQQSYGSPHQPVDRNNHMIPFTFLKTATIV